MQWPAKQTWGYIAALAGCLVLAVVIGWQQAGSQIDNNAYDWMFRKYRPPETCSERDPRRPRYDD